MRFLFLLSLLPTLALAQPPAAQMDPEQFYEQSRQAMLSMIQESLPAMSDARSCLQGADDQAAFEKCAQIMVELEKKMRARMGGVHPGQQPVTDPSQVKWTPEVKQKMLAFLEGSIASGTVMKDCLTQSDTADQMQTCMQSAKSHP